MKLDGSTGKLLLRQSMQGILPDSILHRAKMGFPVPTQTWLQGQLKQFTRDTLLASDSASRRYFDPDVVEEIVKGQEAGADRHQELWTLMIFEFWHRIFIEKRLSPTAGSS